MRLNFLKTQRQKKERKSDCEILAEESEKKNIDKT